MRARLLLVLPLLLLGCEDPPEEVDAGDETSDAGDPSMDAGDGTTDAGGETDAGPGGTDAGTEGMHPVWVGVGNWGFRTSTEDGVTWATTMNPSTGNDHSPDLLRDVSWGDGVFVAVGGDANSMVMRSTDGVTWQEDLHPAGGQWKGGVAFGGGRWVAVGGVGTTLVSDDGGLTWRDGAERTPSAGRNVAWGDGQFVAVGDSGMIAVSSDGDAWTDRSVGGIRLGGVAHGLGVWVVTGSEWNGSGFDTACFKSEDGAVTWSACDFTASRFDSVLSTGGLMIVSHGEGYEYSSDGASWARVDVDIPARVFEADGLWVGQANERTFHGAALDALTRGDDSPRGFRSFTVGWVAD